MENAWIIVLQKMLPSFLCHHYRTFKSKMISGKMSFRRDVPKPSGRGIPRETENEFMGSNEIKDVVP